MFDTVTSARALMGLSLAFHIIFATIGIGLPLLLLIAEGIALRSGDETYLRMAKRWGRVAATSSTSSWWRQRRSARWAR